jgi:hypothetical protein
MYTKKDIQMVAGSEIPIVIYVDNFKMFLLIPCCLHNMIMFELPDKIELGHTCIC